MLSFVKELSIFMIQRRKFWLIPISVMTVLLGGLLVLAEGSAIAPFVYTLY